MAQNSGPPDPSHEPYPRPSSQDVQTNLEKYEIRQDNDLESSGASTGAPEKTEDSPSQFNWDTDPANPLNWSSWKKTRQVVAISAVAFLASVATSIMSPAHSALMQEFGVTSTQAILPLSMYVFALALGPVVGSPLSETVGRVPVYAVGTPLGILFTLGAGFTHSFAALCVLRFLAGFCLAPSLAIATGTINEMYEPALRGMPSSVFILMPFLGPGFGPVIGSFVVNRKGWRWTQWTLVFFGIFALLTMISLRETFHPKIKSRRLRELGLPSPAPPPLSARVRTFATVSLLRPVHMLLTEPIVGLTSLYVACEFATLFSFFAAVPYTFGRVYHFSLEQSGLVFLSVVVGCLLGTITIILCNVVFYLPQTRRHPPHRTPPEYRLYPAMIGSLGLPLGLFWFAWTARSDISWASPAVAIIPFSWGNLCLFVSSVQYLVDTYRGSYIASAAGANSLARYGLAGVLPLVVLQMYQGLGIGWATSLLGFIAAAQLPVPWLFFKYGQRIRQKSKYETVQF